MRSSLTGQRDIRSLQRACRSHCYMNDTVRGTTLVPAGGGAASQSMTPYLSSFPRAVSYAVHHSRASGNFRACVMWTGGAVSGWTTVGMVFSRWANVRKAMVLVGVGSVCAPTGWKSCNLMRTLRPSLVCAMMCFISAIPMWRAATLRLSNFDWGRRTAYARSGQMRTRSAT